MSTSGRSDTWYLPDFLEKRRQEMPFDLAFDPQIESYAAWSERVRGLWIDALPPMDGPARGVVSGDDVTLTFATGAQAIGKFVVPEGRGPFPAVLLLHDHGGRFDIGWKKMFETPASDAPRHVLYDGLAPARAFIDASFAVLCVDALGWGRRFVGGYDAQQALSANAAGLGWSLAGIVAAEDAQAAHWLAERPEIDANRIACFGFSYGGFRSWQVAALSPHIRAAASLSWMAQRADLMEAGSPLLRGQSAFYMLHPTMSARADFPDLAGLAAQKPLFFRSGSGDPHMPEASVLAAWDRISEIAETARGPAPNVAMHDAQHTCPRGCLLDAVAFLKSHL